MVLKRFSLQNEAEAIDKKTHQALYMSKEICRKVQWIPFPRHTPNVAILVK